MRHLAVKEGPSMRHNPKAMAQVLTVEGFLRWCEGKPLNAQDFKSQV
jgi:hypothetical protein